MLSEKQTVNALNNALFPCLIYFKKDISFYSFGRRFHSCVHWLLITVQSELHEFRNRKVRSSKARGHKCWSESVGAGDISCTDPRLMWRPSVIKVGLLSDRRFGWTLNGCVWSSWDHRLSSCCLYRWTCCEIKLSLVYTRSRTGSLCTARFMKVTVHCEMMKGVRGGAVTLVLQQGASFIQSVFICWNDLLNLKRVWGFNDRYVCPISNLGADVC